MISHILPASTCIASPIINILHTLHTFTMDEPILTIISIQSSSLTSGFTLVHSVSLSKSLMICIHHCSNIQRSQLSTSSVLCSFILSPQISWQPFYAHQIRNSPIFPLPCCSQSNFFHKCVYNLIKWILCICLYGIYFLFSTHLCLSHI